MNEIWILGAAGRTGAAIAARLTAEGLPLVLVGRDTARLRALAGALGGDPRVVTTGSVNAMATELSRSQPAVVINTIGPFTETAARVARACPAGAHYLDLSNELLSILDVLGLHDEAASSGRTFVAGAGFGVLATESVVLKLCEDQPPAERVRVDAIPMVESEPGFIGSALAATIVGALAVGGRQYIQGRLARTRLFGDPETLTLPDGSTVKTADGASGDLEAARRASGAAFAVAASSMAPTAPLLRAVLPTALTLLRIKAVSDFAKRRIAGVEVKPSKPDAPKGREFSWTHAQVQWASGAVREGWLRAGDGMTFTTRAAAEVAIRLARGEGKPGAYTPGALFGPELAVKAGGTFVLEP